MSTRVLIVIFHEIAIKWYESELQNQLVLLDISTYHNVGSPWSLHFKFCRMIYLFNTFNMKDFHLCSWLLSYDLSKISAKLAISLKHNIIFAKFLKILLDNNVTSSLTHIRWRSKNHWEVIWVYIFQFIIKGTISPN